MDGENQFDISVGTEDDDTVVRVHGELDLITAPLLRDTVEKLHRSNVVLDLSGVEFMNSSGLSVLIVLTKRLRAEGGNLVLRGATPMLTKTFTIAGVDEMLTLEPAAARPSNDGGATA